MSFETAFIDLMNSTVTISTRTTANNYGEFSYGSGTSYRARIVDKPEFVRTETGEVIETRTVCWIRSTGNTVTVDDRITLPGGATPPIVAVERYPDEDGPHHIKLILGY